MAAEAPEPPQESPSCNVAGIWSESWRGTAAADGRRMSGRATETIKLVGGALKGTGVDKSDPKSVWYGTVKVEGSRITFDFNAEDDSYNGRYTCRFQGDGCDTLACKVDIKNRDGSPNMTSTATWTRKKP